MDAVTKRIRTTNIAVGNVKSGIPGCTMTDTKPNESKDVPVESFHDHRLDMAYWYPRVRGLDVPTPESKPLPIERQENGPPKWDEGRGVEIVEQFGGEAFVRSGYKSAQHQLEEGSHIRAPTIEEFDRTLLELASQHVMMQMPMGESFWIREWLDLNFCHYSRHNLVPEVRAFVRDGEVVCHHPRLEGFDDHDDHRKLVEEFIENAWPTELGDGYYRDHEGLEVYAQRVANTFDGDGWWSVDFVMDTNGNWWLTDMALDALYDLETRGAEGYMGISDHPGECENDVENIVTEEP